MPNTPKFRLEELAKTGNLEGLLGELERFLVFWLGDGMPQYAVSKTLPGDKSIPAPLRRLYGFTKRWPAAKIGNVADEIGLNAFAGASNSQLVHLEFLELNEENRLTFIRDNQGLGELAAEKDGDDPVVWVTSDGWDGDDLWQIGNPSLTQFIVTFCLEILVFGAKHGHWDKQLTNILRTQTKIATPLWINKPYWWHTPLHSFYLINENVLALDVGDGNCFFAANCEAGIKWIKENQAPITRVSVSSTVINNMRWSASINADGSGTLSPITYGCGYEKDTWHFSANTFEFEPILEKLLTVRADYEDKVASVTFFRDGRGYSNGEGVSDAQVIDDIFLEAFSKVKERKDDLKQFRSGRLPKASKPSFWKSLFS